MKRSALVAAPLTREWWSRSRAWRMRWPCCPAGCSLQGWRPLQSRWGRAKRPPVRQCAGHGGGVCAVVGGWSVALPSAGAAHAVTAHIAALAGQPGGGRGAGTTGQQLGLNAGAVRYGLAPPPHAHAQRCNSPELSGWYTISLTCTVMALPPGPGQASSSPTARPSSALPTGARMEILSALPSMSRG